MNEAGGGPGAPKPMPKGPKPKPGKTKGPMKTRKGLYLRR